MISRMIPATTRRTRPALTSAAILWRLLPFVPAAVALLAWLAWFAIDRPPPSVMPAVADVAVTMFHLAFGGRLPGDIVASLARLLGGSALGIATGVAAGFVAGLNRPVATFVNPLAVFFNAISGIVWLPLVIGWLGIGSPLAIFLIWNTVFFIVFQNTVLGVQLVPVALEQGVRSLGGGWWETIRSVTLPGALPYILTGMRSGLGFGWRALIAAELVGATTGLGQLIFNGAEYHRADIIIGGCLLIGAISMAMDRWLLRPIERRTVVRWGLVASGERR